MAITVNVPDNYGYVVLSTLVGQFVVNMMMGGNVMKARDTFDVGYPNLYATPGFHDKADDFNRVQRGHQHFLEYAPYFTMVAMVGGLKNPIACSIYSCLFYLGSYLYQMGYSDSSLDVKSARYKKGGQIQYIGLLGALGCTVSAGASMVMGGWKK